MLWLFSVRRPSSGTRKKLKNMSFHPRNNAIYLLLVFMHPQILSLLLMSMLQPHTQQNTSGSLIHLMARGPHSSFNLEMPVQTPLVDLCVCSKDQLALVLSNGTSRGHSHFQLLESEAQLWSQSHATMKLSLVSFFNLCPFLHFVCLL